MTTQYAVTKIATVNGRIKLVEPAEWHPAPDDLLSLRRELESLYADRLHHRGNGAPAPRDVAGDIALIIKTDHHERPRFLYAREVFCGDVRWTIVPAARFSWA